MPCQLPVNRVVQELAFSRLDSQAGLEDVNLAFRNITSQLHVARTVQRQTSEEEAACQLRLQAARAEEQACHQNPARARVQAALDGYFNSDRLVFHHFMENYWQPSKVSRTIADRGLLMVAGPAKLTANAFVNLHVIHHHLNSTIPTTLYYWGAHEPDRINAATQAFIMVTGAWGVYFLFWEKIVKVVRCLALVECCNSWHLGFWHAVHPRNFAS